MGAHRQAMKLNQLICIAAILNLVSTRAEDWPNWRGPRFNGSTDEKGLPANWTKSDALWSVEMPGPSAATLTSAVLDRLLHHAETITIEGKSYRMKDQIQET